MKRILTGQGPENKSEGALFQAFIVQHKAAVLPMQQLTMHALPVKEK